MPPRVRLRSGIEISYQPGAVHAQLSITTVEGRLPTTVRTESGDRATSGYDALILDAMCKQSLASARSLGRAGLRVALAESLGQFDPATPPPAFRSRHCAHHLILPSYTDDAAAFGDAVIDFTRQHPTRVVLPTSDASIAVLTPRRAELAALDCVLALAPDTALEIANDKQRTLTLADKLGIAYPESIPISSVAELPDAIAKFSFPFVLKPTISWTGRSPGRTVPVEVVNEVEAITATERFLATGCGVLAQQWASGRREGVTLFIAGDSVLASCGHIAHRTSPLLGGSSVLRESIAPSKDILEPSIKLAIAIGLQGACEVEFRRDHNGRPLLMEVNARLAGTLENAVRSGVDFPLMIWQWATGTSVDSVDSYRIGVRTRWLRGDLQWLAENLKQAGRPDTVPRARSVWAFTSEFLRTRYYDVIDVRDLGPTTAELASTVTSGLRYLRRK